MTYLLIIITIIVAEIFIKDKIIGMKESVFPMELISKKLSVERCYNSGIAFSKLKKRPMFVKYMTGIFVIILVLGLTPFLFNSKAHKLRKIAYALILGGALSNVGDRYKRGYVVDYIRFSPFKKKSRIVFNIADVAILLGSIVTLLDEIVHN